jgi:hypothetical protein
MSNFEERKVEFIDQMRDLLKQVEDIKFSRENFGKKLQLIHRVHKLNYDNLDFIFYEFTSEKFRESITKKPDENLLEAQKYYLLLNNEKRLDPESKRIYREFCEFILHYKTVLAAKHLEFQARKEVKSDLKFVIPLTAHSKNNEENHVRRSSRLAKKTEQRKEVEEITDEIQEEANVVLRRSSRIAAAHKEA